MVQFEDILRQVQSYRAGEDLSLLRRAYDFTALSTPTRSAFPASPSFPIRWKWCTSSPA